MSKDNRIVGLMSMKINDHDLDWLKESLQAAIKFELSTLPPYLTAMWSIKNGMDPISRSIREIAREEMLHMALMCNLLVALDETPMIDTKEGVPSYPGPLPGGINPELIVPLQGLSLEAVKLFMDIEFPENGPVAFADIKVETYPTIGSFYSAILEAFERLQPTLSTERQLEGALGLTKLATLQDVRNAINFIVRQGEGSNASPDDTGPDDLAHYYRFAEIYHGRRLNKNANTGEWLFDGDPIPFPDVWPMSKVPVGGYQQAEVLDQGVWHLIQSFDDKYTLLLNQLQASWQDGSQVELSKAISTMFSLRQLAVSLMQKPLPTGSGNYGPCWRLSDNI